MYKYEKEFFLFVKNSYQKMDKEFLLLLGKLMEM